MTIFNFSYSQQSLRSISKILIVKLKLFLVVDTISLLLIHSFLIFLGCELKSSTIGQANAARNKLYDLRQCDLKGQSGAGKDMSGAIFSEADFSGVNFKEGCMIYINIFMMIR